MLIDIDNGFNEFTKIARHFFIAAAAVPRTLEGGCGVAGRAQLLTISDLNRLFETVLNSYVKTQTDLLSKSFWREGQKNSN